MIPRERWLAVLSRQKLNCIPMDYWTTVEIESGIVNGKFPKRALRAVLDWLDLHKKELLVDWELAINKQPLNKIEPLE